MRKMVFRMSTAAIAGSLLMVATACGGDEDKKDSAKPAGSVAGPSTAPVVSAPAAPSAPAAAPSAEASKAASGAALTQAQLQSALLVAAELPQGVYSTEGRDAGDRSFAEPASCQALVDLSMPNQGTPKPTAGGQASSIIGGQMPTTIITTELYSFAGNDAATVLAKGRDALKNCGSVSVVGADGETSVNKYQEIAHAKLGDETLAIGLTPQDGGALGVVIVRSGPTLIMVSNAEPAGTVAALPSDALVTKQIEKVAAAAKS
ncbi:hypothetical protein [Streptomyces sp. SID3343]|uniref:hypothetical protein n=1 Tax=Streptomyces sp. SID3343 TaxID=2690260 RepID=UPI00136ABB3F|nr:hypothetical protein [Streptomyces sp. SID3343]MYW02294.1 hypothetical protein [Streptomyces sp. SID3343]